MIKTHLCDKADFAKFYEPTAASAQAIKHLQESNSMICLDEKDVDGNEIDWKLYGESEIEGHRRLDILYLPCKPVLKRTAKPGEVCLVDSLTDEAVLKAKLDEIIKYVGMPDFELIYNDEEPNLAEFNDKRITQFSAVKNKQFKADEPTFIDAKLHMNTLEDMTYFVQFA